MNLWLLIPVKPFHEGKSRLRGTLTDPIRAELSRTLFHHVVSQALAIPDLAGILVVSRDRSVLAGIHSPKLHLVPESGRDLNQALEQGRREALRRGAETLLVLPADLPDLTTAEIVAVSRQGQQETLVPGIVIVPSADNGTNALLLRPPTVINFAFGRDSFTHHCDGCTIGWACLCTVYASPALCLDVDQPADLARLPLERLTSCYDSAAFPQASR
ncbi:MAG: 2-phospho-L-lactate guanylyltransferase [Caldilineaceae bacterium]